MGYRLSKITTKTGDKGTTQLEPGKRISKNDLRIHALGDLDELNSFIGLVIAYQPKHPDIPALLQQIQQDLFNLSGELCPPFRTAVHEEQTHFLEKNIAEWNEQLPPLKEFILPGGNPISATCHVARTVCRRVERTLVALNEEQTFSPEILRYINRLSDLLFIVARILSQETASPEILWEHKK